MSSLKREIQQKAYQIGFDLCGFTNDFEPKERSYFLDWLNQKKYGDMSWLNRNTDKRLQPQLLLDNTQSAIVLAVSYATETTLHDYQIARYAHGEDYHIWMKNKVEDLASWIQEQMGHAVNWRSFVDTGPVLERDLACKAGLGWVGKNTNLIHEEWGSFLFLAVLFTDIRFQPDVPQADLCGSCTLCLEACPTQALTPYQLDARKCLAYHNIEKRGVREELYWKSIDHHLIGCDICQDVCPHNQRGQETRQKDWQNNFMKYDLGDLKDILKLSENEYKKKTQSSAIQRVRYLDFMRNVFLVIANTQRQDLLPDVLNWQSRQTIDLEECVWCIQQLKK